MDVKDSQTNERSHSKYIFLELKDVLLDNIKKRMYAFKRTMPRIHFDKVQPLLTQKPKHQNYCVELLFEIVCSPSTMTSDVWSLCYRYRCLLRVGSSALGEYFSFLSSKWPLT